MYHTGNEPYLDVPVFKQNVQHDHDSRQTLYDKMILRIPPVSRQDDNLEIHIRTRNSETSTFDGNECPTHYSLSLSLILSTRRDGHERRGTIPRCTGIQNVHLLRREGLRTYLFITPVRSTLQKPHGGDNKGAIRMRRVCLVVHVHDPCMPTHTFS